VAERYLATLYELQQGESKLATDDEKSVNNDEFDYKDARETLINGSTLRNDIQFFKFNPDQSAFGSGAARIVSVKLLNENGEPLSWVAGGSIIILEIRCKAYQKLTHPILGFVFKDRLGQVLFADNTYLSYMLETVIIDVGKEFVARFEFRMPILSPGSYTISPAVAEGTQDEHIQHHWIHDALIIQVHSSSVCFGIFSVPMKSIKMFAV
jgi:lipopolysaccharide transport system ATP-binding protein